MKKSHKNKEYKLIHITMGLAIGFFLGGAVVYYGFNRQNVSFLSPDILALQPKESIRSSEYDESVLENNNEAEMDERLNHDTIDNVLNSESAQMIEKDYNPSDSLLLTNKEGNHLPEVDTTSNLKFNFYNLNLQNDTFSLFFNRPESETEDTHLIKDRLLHTKIIQNPKIDDHQSHTRYPILDSIMGKPTVETDQSNIIVEFWETPLSSKGYIKGKNKLILYGISLHNFVALKYYDDIIYLKYLNQFYPLEFTSEFKPLNPVSDLELIEQLQQL